jgi:hypothetical protein
MKFFLLFLDHCGSYLQKCVHMHRCCVSLNTLTCLGGFNYSFKTCWPCTHMQWLELLVVRQLLLLLLFSRVTVKEQAVP